MLEADLFTNLVSCLTISSRRVLPISCGSVELVRANLDFGFADGAYSAVTDTFDDYYSFEIRRRTAQQHREQNMGAHSGSAHPCFLEGREL